MNRSTIRRGIRTVRVTAGFVALAIALMAAGCGGDVESRMQEVRALQDVGQFTESIDELREVLAISPDLPEANYRLGAALVQTGDPSRAIWALKKASESEEFSIQAGLMLASAHFTVNDLEEAVRAANRVLELSPERIAALQLRAKANLGVHDLDAALADTERLIELAPDDYTNRAIHATVLFDMGRGEEAEAAHELLKEMGEANSDPSLRPRACIAMAIFEKDFKKNLVEAERLFLECVDKYPTDAFLINHVMGFLDGIDEPEKATSLVRKAMESAPENLSLRSTLANRLSSEGDEEGAEKVLVEAAETFDSAAAWNLVAAFHRRTNQPEKALAAVEKVIELTGGGGNELRFTQADILVDLERYDEAEAIVKTVDEPIYATLIRGRIQLAQGDPAAALQSFDKGIRHWPNNPGARYLAGVAAHELGDFERAVSELREAMRADKTQSEAAQLLARIYYDRGEYQEAVKFSGASVRRNKDDQDPANYVLATRAFTKMGEYDKARGAAASLGAIPGQQASAVAELAHVARAEGGPQAAVDTITASKLDLADSANSDVARVLIDNLLTLGKPGKALALVDAAIERNPDTAEFHGMRGTVLTRMRRFDDGMAAFEKARTLDAENAEALAGIATIAGNAGDIPKAIEFFDLAAEYAEESTGSYAYSAAQLTLKSGDRAGAMKRYREIIRMHAGHAGARNDLAWLLAESGEDLDTAVALASDARRLDDSADILDTLGWVYIQRGDGALAVETLDVAHSKRPDSASIRYHLGTALALTGDADRAREMLESALGSEGFDDVDAARRELAKLQP
jgi:tetratricopeptide (TPR) repeat protein